MRIVTYSLSRVGPAQITDYHEQLLSSVKSLRTYNSVVPVHVFLYGEHPDRFITELEREAATVHSMGSYLDAIRRHRPRAFRTLVRYPVLHKWMNFHKLAPLGPSQVLQIDCDTFFFDDVEILFERYSDCHFYGREEPMSKASPYGYDPNYLDEDKLFALARRERAQPMKPCNIGVSVLNHGLWSEVAKRAEMFLAYVFRFIACLGRDPQTVGRLWPELAEVVMLDLIEQPDVEDLPFPSSNVWIIEQVALWLTLGHIPGLTHGHLSRDHVLQGGEDNGSSETKVVHHYFGVDKTAFLSSLRTAVSTSTR
ncbi:MAG TPA: hypothetical protein VFS90_21170 [Pyrinomonadaceae bacterium]|nr:hypothetical protein [Pyrinomonadaceae bacterium]